MADRYSKNCWSREGHQRWQFSWCGLSWNRLCKSCLAIQLGKSSFYGSDWTKINRWGIHSTENQALEIPKGVKGLS